MTAGEDLDPDRLRFAEAREVTLGTIPWFHVIVATLLACTTWCNGEEVITADAFAREAEDCLPLEEPYEFSRAISEGREPQWQRDPEARLGTNEMGLPESGWKLLLPAGAGTILKTAAQEFAGYMAQTMGVKLTTETRTTLADWKGVKKAIIAATVRDLEGCGPALRASKDYRILVSGEQVVVCGYDERGAMYGLYNLEARMNLREAPSLPKNLDVTRHSLYQSRQTLSGLGWMEWPDRYLATIARYGFDSIFASVYTNPNGAPGVPVGGLGRFPPYWDKWKKQNPAKVHDLLRRAARFGLDVYAPIIFLYTGDPGFDEEGLRKLVRDVVTEFPEIRGYVLLTEGFAYKTWFGAGRMSDAEGKAWAKDWVRLVDIVNEECRRLNPEVEVLVWEYNVPFRAENVALKTHVTNLLPRETIPLLTFENGKSFELDGQAAWVRDYSISQIGPAEVTEAQIKAARQRGMRAVYSKADAWASWQFGSFPYIPAPYQWHARYKALEERGINGTLESWSYGFKPNFVAEMRAWFCWSEPLALDDLLRQIARREFGAGTEELVLQAWEHFSRAIRLVPDTGPRWGTVAAVATPMFLEKPLPRAMTVEHSWFNQGLWTQTSRLNPYWPYQWNNMMLWPDFSGRANAARQYVSPFTLPVFSKYTLSAADEFEQGLHTYRRAALQSPPSKRRRAFREVMLVEHMQRMLRSANAVLEFEDLRFRASKESNPVELRRIADRMTAVLNEELGRTERSLAAARRDSRLGYEWEMDYVYTPYVLNEKLELLRNTLQQQMVSFRKMHGLF